MFRAQNDEATRGMFQAGDKGMRCVSKMMKIDFVRLISYEKQVSQTNRQNANRTRQSYLQLTEIDSRSSLGRFAVGNLTDICCEN